jgi:hypothetical protein
MIGLRAHDRRIQIRYLAAAAAAAAAADFLSLKGQDRLWSHPNPYPTGMKPFLGA